MAVLGRATLLLALAVSAYGIGASLYGVRRNQPEWADSGRRAVYALALILTVAFLVLEAAFLRNDFSFDTVAQTSSSTTPGFYRAAAVWSSQQGSLLLWAWLESLWSSLILFMTRKRLRDITPYATAILLGFCAFFVSLMVFYATPFNTTTPAPADGSGLDPLLRHPSMMIHPPMLYSGYTLSIIPFAFAAAALIARRIDADWLRATRRFALAAWLFLGIGILLGARWSYAELGWGGYWEWDPVENAALLPWLTLTALLHSMMIQEKRGMLKIWNASLMLATGILAVMGTFLVRSGVLSSIHAFGGSTLGVPFVALIGVMIASSLYLVVSRRDLLRSEHRIDSLLSREAVFLANNFVLVGLVFVILWGTYFPLISEAVTGQTESVAAPWFDRYTVPLALLLVLLSGIGPVIAWRRATAANARRNLLAPFAVSVLVLVAILGAGVSGSVRAIAMFVCASFAAACIAQEFWRGVRVRRALAHESPPVALYSLVRRNRRRYGGYIVHLGIAVLFVGIAASSSFRHEAELSLSVGQSASVGPYRVTYVRNTAKVLPANDPSQTGATLNLGAVLRVSRGGHVVTTLYPGAGYYNTPDPTQPVGHLIGGETVSHVGLDATALRDYWAAIQPDISTPKLQGLINAANRTIPYDRPDEGIIAIALLARDYLKAPPPALFHFLISPLVTWIWAGGLIAGLGALIAMWPPPGLVRRRVTVASRWARGLSRA